MEVIYVETLAGTAFEIRVSPFDTIMSVKAKIQRMEGIPVSQQHLVWQSRELEDGYCLQDYRITDGSTIKLVLAMRGGPINTRRVPVEDPTWREMMEYMEANREEIWEKLPGGRQVTLLVFRDGDQINFFRVIDRGDGTLSPLAESISAIRNLTEDSGEDTVAHEREVENDVTLQKMRALRKKMDALTIKKKLPPKKMRSHNPAPNRPSSRSTSHHVVAVKSNIHNAGFSLNKHLRLPPVHTQSSAVKSPGSSDLHSPKSGHVRSRRHAMEGSETHFVHDRAGCSNTFEELATLENSINISETGALPKAGRRANFASETECSKMRTGHRAPTLETYRRSLMQLRASVTPSPTDLEGNTISDLKLTYEDKGRGNIPASGRRRSLYAGHRLETVEADDVRHAITNLEPGISLGRTTAHNVASAATFHNDRMLLRSQQRMVGRVQDVDKDDLIGFRPKTTPEKWDKSTSDLSVASQDISQASKEICDILSRTRSKVRSPVSPRLSRDRDRRRAESIDPILELDVRGRTGRGRVARDRSQELELVKSLMAVAVTSEDFPDDYDEKLPQDSMLKPTRFERRLSASRHGRLNSAHKLPPVTVAAPRVPATTVPRCQVCHKKTGLATTYTCRCGRNFCASHRYAETHNCTFDYKREGRRALEQANPIVAAPKLPKI